MCKFSDLPTPLHAVRRSNERVRELQAILRKMQVCVGHKNSPDPTRLLDFRRRRSAGEIVLESEKVWLEPYHLDMEIIVQFVWVPRLFTQFKSPRDARTAFIRTFTYAHPAARLSVSPVVHQRAGPRARAQGGFCGYRRWTVPGGSRGRWRRRRGGHGGGVAGSDDV